jgi:formate-dependent nitrite reductase membrane component NrfD
VTAATDGLDLLALARTVYDVAHPARPWGWRVGAYLWTKSIAAGAFLVAALGLVGGLLTADGLTGLAVPAIGLAFLVLTSLLLILDLKRPDRFLYLIFKPNPRSWLVLGGFILFAAGGLGGLWLLAGLAGNLPALQLLAWPMVAVAAATAGYSAFLFGQAEGRDFWQSPLVLPHLIIAAVVAGAAALSIAAAMSTPESPRADPITTLWPLMFLALAAHGFLMALEVFNRHAVHDASLAARLIRRGPYRATFYGGVVVGGVVLPMALLIAGAAADSATLSTLAALLALAGLWLWEDIWVKAGQSVPLS